jgi:hypothetical protein
MSKGTRERFADQSKSSAADAPPAPPIPEELDAEGEPTEAEETITTPLGVLRRLTAATDLEISEDGATLYLAYLEARARLNPGLPIAKYPPDPVAYARELRRSCPHVWAQIRAMNFVGLARALDMHGLPRVEHDVLQASATTIRTAKPPQ